MAGERRRCRNGTIRQLPSGLYQLRLRVPDSLPPKYYPAPRRFERRAEAEVVLAKHNAAISAGTWRHPDDLKREAARAAQVEEARRLTVAEAVEEWLVAAGRGDEGRMKTGTIYTYRSRLAQVLDEWGSARVADIAEDAVVAWYRAEAAASSRSRAWLLAQALDRVLRRVAAQHPDIIAASPVNIPEKERPSRSPSAGVLIPDDAIDAIAAAMPAPLGAAVLAAGWLGLRAGEVRALAADAFEHDAVRVFRNAQAKGGARIETPKIAAGARVLPIPQRIRPALDAAREDALPWLFPASRDASRPISATAFDNRWHAALDAVRGRGVTLPERVRFHDLRHTALTRLARVGATDTDLLMFGGHDDPAVAARYQHTEASRLAELVARL